MSKPFSELTKNFSQERKDRVKALTQKFIDEMPTEMRDIVLKRKEKVFPSVIPIHITAENITGMYGHDILMNGNSKPLDKDTMDRSNN